MSKTLPPRRTGALAGVLATLVLGLLAAGCTSSDDPSLTVTTPQAMYGQIVDNDITIPAVPAGMVQPQYFRQVVATPGYITAPPGTIVVDPQSKFLYLVDAGGRSMRYGIGVGREGFAWSGEAVIKSKQQWPKWFPPAEMMARDPEAAKYPNGMEGGLQNPLGARALYLYQGNVDTLYRLHGTNDPRSIGRAVSSGCVRLMNQDIIDLYERVPLGTKVIVLGPETTSPMADIFVPRTPPVAVGGGTQVPAG